MALVFCHPFFLHPPFPPLFHLPVLLFPAVPSLLILFQFECHILHAHPRSCSYLFIFYSSILSVRRCERPARPRVNVENHVFRTRFTKINKTAATSCSECQTREDAACCSSYMRLFIGLITVKGRTDSDTKVRIPNCTNGNILPVKLYWFCTNI